MKLDNFHCLDKSGIAAGCIDRNVESITRKMKRILRIDNVIKRNGSVIYIFA